jgi:prevent-host-death family protein
MQQYVSMPNPSKADSQEKEMAKQAVITATEAHRAFGKLLKRVYGSDEHLIVEREGFRVAVIMSYQEYENLRRQQATAAFEQFSRELGKEVDRQGITEEQLLEELEQDRQALYQEKYGQPAG